MANSTVSVELGRVPVNRGDFSGQTTQGNTTRFYKDNIIQYNGSAYICHPTAYHPTTNPNAYVISLPDTDSTNWGVFADGAITEMGKVALGAVYDVSALHPTSGEGGTNKYVSLPAALAVIPQDKRHGGMSVKFVLSSDNIYVQYRLMKDEFSTTESDWQGVDETPTAGSQNLVTSGGVIYKQREGEKSVLDCVSSGIASQITVLNNTKKQGYYNNAVVNGGKGEYVTGPGNYHLIIPISSLYCGFNVSLNYAIQYAFISSYVDGEYIQYCDGCNRVSGIPSNVTIPFDCNYIYVYLSTDTSDIVCSFNTPTSCLNGLFEELQSANSDINDINEELAPIQDRLDSFDRIYFFNKTSTKAVLTNPIVLESNGDSIQFKVLSVGSIDTQQNQMYSFSYGKNTNAVSIGISSTKIWLRSSDSSSTWIASGASYSNGFAGHTVKISYEDSKIKVYVDNEVITTYNGQVPLEVACLGWNNTYGYWEGSIGSIAVNGSKYIISDSNTSLNTLITTTIGSILTKTEQAYIYPSMFIEKTSGKVSIYIKNSFGTYVNIPFVHRVVSYTEGQYPSFLDNWGIDVLKESEYNVQMIDVATLFKSGEAELAIQVPRGDGQSGSAYVGGRAHGFENIAVDDGNREIVMLLNGEVISETSEFTLKEANRFEVYANSLIYQAYTNSNPWGVVTKHWVFTKDGVQITSKVKVTRSLEISFAQFGMFCVNRHLDGNSSKPYLASKVIKNDTPYVITEIEDGWWNDNTSPVRLADYNCSKMNVWGDSNYGFSFEISNATLKPSNATQFSTTATYSVGDHVQYNGYFWECNNAVTAPGSWTGSTNWTLLTSHGGMFVGTNNGQEYNKLYFDLTGTYTPAVDEELYATQTWYINKTEANEE